MRTTLRLPSQREMLIDMKARSISVVLAFMLAGCAYAQAILHRTLSEYNNKTGEDVGDFVELTGGIGSPILHFKKGEENIKVPCKDIWGFTYKEVLFRIHPQEDVPVRLMTKGGICYYENGYAHLHMQRERVEEATFHKGMRSYVSKDLEGPIVPAIFSAEDTRSASARFRAENPQYESLFQCIGGYDDIDRIRQCVVDFEVMLEGE